MSPGQSADVSRVVVLGGGTAGLITAGLIKKENPDIAVTVIRSPEIGHIMVGEGSVGSTPRFLHERLGIDVGDFFDQVRPTPKLGIRFAWGPRPSFDYTFTRQYTRRRIGSDPLELGYYCAPNGPLGNVSLMSAMMSQNHIPARFRDGGSNGQETLTSDPDETMYAYHFENEAFVQALDRHALTLGVEIVSDTVLEAIAGPAGVAEVRTAQGRTVTADLWVDASGFRRVLIGGALEEPVVPLSDQLLCDRAVVGGWNRAGDEPLKPYTTAETMQAGWSWQIEHEEMINRGYVYSTAHISDDEALAEFTVANPRVVAPRVVSFTPGRSRRAWIGNVVAVGNACGFVEPLEATNIQVIAGHAGSISSSLQTSRSPSEQIRLAHNRRVERQWTRIADFLALHYRFNTRLDTPFWRDARAVSIGALHELVTYYQEVGPSSTGEIFVPPGDPFGLEGHLAMLVGMALPHGSEHCALDAARQQRFRMFTAAIQLRARHIERAESQRPSS